VLSRFMNLIAVLAFLTIDGHLQVLGVLIDSFYRVPITATPSHRRHCRARTPAAYPTMARGTPPS